MLIINNLSSQLITEVSFSSDQNQRTFKNSSSQVKSSRSYLELLQLLFDHLHLRADHALNVQTLFGSSQQTSQLPHQPVEVLDLLSGVLDLVQPGLAALTQLTGQEAGS